MLDRIDTRILETLQADGRASQARVAQAVGLSAPAVNERIRKLEAAGIIQRYVAVVDPHKVGAAVTAFVEVFIEHPRSEAPFIKRVAAVTEVQEVHHVTGEFSLMLKVRTASMDTLRTLLMDTINALPGVRQTRTVIVLATAKEETRVTLAGANGDASDTPGPAARRARRRRTQEKTR